MGKVYPKILITGTSGFLGSACSKFLKHKKVRVVSYDIRENSTHDIRDLLRLKSCMRGVSGIIHTAGISRPKQVFANPAESIDINIRGTLNVLEAARSQKKNPWVLFASSREVFGDKPKRRVTETSPRDIKDIYVASKVACEDLCRAYSRQYGIKTRVVRFSNLYTDVNDFRDRVIPKFIISASKGEDLNIGGKGDESFDFVYIKDAVWAVWKVMHDAEKRAVLYDDFNIVSAETVTLPHAARLICSKLGSESKIYVNHAQKTAVSNFSGDYSKAKKLLGYRPRTTFEKGILFAIREFKKAHIIE